MILVAGSRRRRTFAPLKWDRSLPGVGNDNPERMRIYYAKRWGWCSVHVHDHVSRYSRDWEENSRSTRVIATAIVYFKRVYLECARVCSVLIVCLSYVIARRTFVQMDPSLVIPTCIFIASKVEEAAVNAKQSLRLLKSVGAFFVFCSTQQLLTARARVRRELAVPAAAYSDNGALRDGGAAFPVHGLPSIPFVATVRLLGYFVVCTCVCRSRCRTGLQRMQRCKTYLRPLGTCVCLRVSVHTATLMRHVLRRLVDAYLFRFVCVCVCVCVSGDGRRICNDSYRSDVCLCYPPHILPSHVCTLLRLFRTAICHAGCVICSRPIEVHVTVLPSPPTPPPFNLITDHPSPCVGECVCR